MKNKYSILVIIFGFSLVEAQIEMIVEPIETSYVTESEKVVEPDGKAKAKGCYCYCAFKPGYRLVEPQDDPVYKQEYGLCFCHDRDVKEYERIGRPKIPKTELPLCCEQK